MRVNCSCGTTLQVAEGKSAASVRCPKCASVLSPRSASVEPEFRILEENDPPEHRCPYCGVVIAAETVRCPPCFHELKGLPTQGPGRLARPRHLAAFRLFDLANVSLLIAVTLSFFLPLLVYEVGPMKIESTGIHLASGKKPGKGNNQERSLDRTGKPLPRDRALWLVPALGALGAMAALAMLFRPDVGTSRLAIFFAVVPLILVFGWFLVKDFQIESAERAELAKARSEFGAEFDSDFSIHKSSWFYAGLGLSVLALTCASLRKFSPWVGFLRPEAPALEAEAMRPSTSAPPRPPPLTPHRTGSPPSPSTGGSSGSLPTRGSPS